jgi:Arc/MetJ family transcription regulator
VKVTLQIDDALLERLMKATGVSSKAQAIDLALQQIDREMLADIHTSARAIKRNRKVPRAAASQHRKGNGR